MVISNAERTVKCRLAPRVYAWIDCASKCMSILPGCMLVKIVYFAPNFARGIYPYLLQYETATLSCRPLYTFELIILELKERK